jgi:hypothetical protein
MAAEAGRSFGTTAALEGSSVTVRLVQKRGAVRVIGCRQATEDE